jgi:hypothetical protein
VVLFFWIRELGAGEVDGIYQGEERRREVGRLAMTSRRRWEAGNIGSIRGDSEM